MAQRRTFAVPPARAGATSGEPPAGPGRNAPAPRTFAAPPGVPWFDAVMRGDGTPGSGFPLPPREVCDECGAQGEEIVGQLAGDPTQPVVTIVTTNGHAPDCFYALWPRRVRALVQLGGDGAAPRCLRPSLARELKLSPMRCSVCRCPVLFDLEYDRKQHAWWCSWWPAHPGVTPF